MKLVDVKYMAEFLNVAEQTIRDWRLKNKIPCYKIEGSLRFDLDEVQKWLSKKKVPGQG